MKLQDCIIMGRFMGLKTVNECVNNYAMHFIPTLPYKEAADDALELNVELAAYDADMLGMDWDFIDKEVKKQNEEFETFCWKDIIKEDWRKG